MRRIANTQAVFLLVLLGLGAAYLAAPYVRLQTEVASGHLDYHALPVAGFTSGTFEEPTTTIHLGRLSMTLPIQAVPEYQDPGSDLSFESMGIREMDGVKFYIATPCPEGAPRYQELIDPPEATKAPYDSVALIAAAYGADCRNSSLWMGRKDAIRLEQLLEIRSVLPPLADRIEILRGPGIKGIVSIATISDGRGVMLVHFYSNDEDMSGSAMLVLDAGSQHGMNLARAMIDSFRISS